MLGKIIAWALGFENVFKDDIKKMEEKSNQAKQEKQYNKELKYMQEYRNRYKGIPDFSHKGRAERGIK